MGAWHVTAVAVAGTFIASLRGVADAGALSKAGQKQYLKTKLE